MTTIFSPNFLSRRPIERALLDFAHHLPSDAKVLDVGCGHKPYAHYFPGHYIGVDHASDSKADIVCDSAAIPLPDSIFDAIICTQTLQHTRDVAGTVSEMYRLLKSGGHCFISVPFAIKIVAQPIPIQDTPQSHIPADHVPIWREDFWRFTKYGLLTLLRDFRIIDITETTGYLGTLFQLSNYAFATLSNTVLFVPIFWLNNLLGLLCDITARLLGSTQLSFLRKFYHNGYLSLTSNYICIAQKR